MLLSIEGCLSLQDRTMLNPNIKYATRDFSFNISRFRFSDPIVENLYRRAPHFTSLGTSLQAFLVTSLHSVSGTLLVTSLQSCLGTAVHLGTLMVLGVLTGTLAQTLSVTVSHLGAT